MCLGNKAGTFARENKLHQYYLGGDVLVTRRYQSNPSNIPNTGFPTVHLFFGNRKMCTHMQL